MARVLVIGGGPAGLLAAMVAAERGDVPAVFDGRPAPSAALVDANKSYPMVVSARGLHGLDVIPGLLEHVRQNAVLMAGAVTHRGRSRSSRRPYTGEMLGVSRDSLTHTLLTFAKSHYADRIAFHWECRCVDVDVALGTACFQNSAGATVSYAADVIVGADGVHSVVRTKMAEAAGFTCAKQETPTISRTIALPRCPPEWAREVQVWPGPVSLILAPTPGGNCSGVIFWRPDDEIDAILSDPQRFKSYFADKFAAAAQYVPDAELEAVARRNPLRPLSVTVSSLHQGRAVLIGDAAHAMSPSLGQGVNSALDDVRHLAGVLEDNGGDWARAIAAFTASRLPDVQAIVWLSSASVYPSTPLGLLWFIFKTVTLTAGNRIAPRLVAPPVFLTLSSTLVPYRKAALSHRAATFFFDRCLPVVGILGLSLSLWRLLGPRSK